MGAVTTLLGPNDVGKTTLLSFVATRLRASRPPSGFGESQAAITFFCACDPWEADFLIANLTGDLRGDDASEHLADPAADVRREIRDAGVWRGRRLDAAIVSAASAREDWINALRASAPPGDAWKEILTELHGSDTLAFTQGLFERRPAWTVHWCLPPLAACPPRLQRALRGSGLPGADPSAGEVSYGEPWPTASSSEAPTPVAPIGMTDIDPLPEPLSVPTSMSEVSARLEDAIGALVNHVRWPPTAQASEDDLDGLPHPEDPDWPGISADPMDGWVGQNEDGMVKQIHDEALLACRTLANCATELLPSFVSSRYELRLVPQPLDSARRISVSLAPRGHSAGFPVTEAAAGYQLWIQLALLETEALVRRYIALLELFLGFWMTAYEDLCEMQDPYESGPGDPSPSALEQAETNATQLLAAHEQLARAALDGLFDLPLKRAQLLGLAGPCDVTSQRKHVLDLWRTTVYFIDEPERHLHPRIQREAAAWLARPDRQTGSQIVTATHSPAFLRAGRDAPLVYIRRQADARAHLDAMDVARLNAMTEQAMDLGFDRGELLATVAVILFVEGRADKAVLDALVGPELRAHGTAIVPMHGASRSTLR